MITLFVGQVLLLDGVTSQWSQLVFFSLYIKVLQLFFGPMYSIIERHIDTNIYK